MSSELQEHMALTWYLSGPMSGYPNNNYQDFNRCAKELRDGGYKVINPADFYPITDRGLTEEEYYEKLIERDLEVIKLCCSGVALLPGHRYSSGSQREVQLAQQLNLSVTQADYLINQAKVVIS